MKKCFINISSSNNFYKRNFFGPTILLRLNNLEPKKLFDFRFFMSKLTVTSQIQKSKLAYHQKAELTKMHSLYFLLKTKKYHTNILIGNE